VNARAALTLRGFCFSFALDFNPNLEATHAKAHCHRLFGDHRSPSGSKLTQRALRATDR